MDEKFDWKTIDDLTEDDVGKVVLVDTVGKDFKFVDGGRTKIEFDARFRYVSFLGEVGKVGSSKVVATYNRHPSGVNENRDDSIYYATLYSYTSETPNTRFAILEQADQETTLNDLMIPGTIIEYVDCRGFNVVGIIRTVDIRSDGIKVTNASGDESTHLPSAGIGLRHWEDLAIDPHADLCKFKILGRIPLYEIPRPTLLSIQ